MGVIGAALRRLALPGGEERLVVYLGDLKIEASLDATRDPSAATTDTVSKRPEHVGGFHILREVGRGGA